MTDKKASRRKFLWQVSLFGAAVLTIPKISNAKSINNFEANDNHDGDGFTFLFQGDSITDGNRGRNMDWNHVLGHGYAYLIAARLWYNHPSKNFHFFNRGVSGNKISDLIVRWQEDAIALKPDAISILIGVNDTTSAVFGDSNFTAASFEEDYRALLTGTKAKLPDVKLIICEPFILPVGKVKDNWDKYQQEIILRQAVAKKLAIEFSALFIPLQELFNKFLTKAPADFWIWDGVHPMPAGHEMIAREWIKQVEKELKFIS